MVQAPAVGLGAQEEDMVVKGVPEWQLLQEANPTVMYGPQQLGGVEEVLALALMEVRVVVLSE